MDTVIIKKFRMLSAVPYTVIAFTVNYFQQFFLTFVGKKGILGTFSRNPLALLFLQKLILCLHLGIRQILYHFMELINLLNT